MGPGGMVRLAVAGEPVNHAEVVAREYRGELFAWLVGRSRQRVAEGKRAERVGGEWSEGDGGGRRRG